MTVKRMERGDSSCTQHTRDTKPSAVLAPRTENTHVLFYCLLGKHSHIQERVLSDGPFILTYIPKIQLTVFVHLIWGFIILKFAS